MRIRHQVFAIIWSVSTLLSCRPEPVEEASAALPTLNLPLPAYSYDYPDMGPAYLSSSLPFFEATPENNPITDAGAALGRVLFYDVRLSANNTIRCATCHQQAYSFADPRAKSRGIHGQSTDRNASHLINLRYNRRQFWDMRAQTLEEQVLMPIQHPVEMGMDLVHLQEKLGGVAYYPDLFQAAFGSPEITSDKISRALSQFIRSMVSYQSKYDEGVATGFTNFTDSENQGKDLFFNSITRCNQCHMTGNFFTPQAFNNGLEYPLQDSGYYHVTGNPADIGKFKVPSLRNVAFTAPYMHDGRFGTLLEVINHYDHGVVAQPTLDDRVTTELTIGGSPYQLQLSEDEKQALVDFLLTLSDSTFIIDPRFADPFTD
jgi:cytochrome c peroxidase